MLGLGLQDVLNKENRVSVDFYEQVGGEVVCHGVLSGGCVVMFFFSPPPRVI